MTPHGPEWYRKTSSIMCCGYTKRFVGHSTVCVVQFHLTPVIQEQGCKNGKQVMQMPLPPTQILALTFSNFFPGSAPDPENTYVVNDPIILISQVQ